MLHQGSPQSFTLFSDSVSITCKFSHTTDETKMKTNARNDEKQQKKNSNRNNRDLLAEFDLPDEDNCPNLTE